MRWEVMGARKSWVSHARPDLSCTHYFQAHATQATSYSTFGAVALECSELGVFQLFLNQSQPRVSNNFNRGHSTARNFSLCFSSNRGPTSIQQLTKLS